MSTATETKAIDREAAAPSGSIWKVSRDDYHADRAHVSHSMLEVFMEDPALFEGRFITGEYPEERSSALDFGTVVHDIILGEPFVIDRDNYAHRTIACWRVCKAPDRLPDFESDSGSAYWYNQEGVTRESNHWGEVGGCYWTLRGRPTRAPFVGSCRWEDFIFNETFRPIPPRVLSKSGSRAGAVWDLFEAENHGAILLKEKEFEPIAFMLDSLRTHPKASAIMGVGGQSEITIRWQDQETGLWLRSRLDRLTKLFIADLKTTHSTNARTFAKDAYNFGYHRQAAFYQDAIKALCGEFRTFVFVAIGKSAPYSVETFVPNAEMVAIGRRENREALRQLAECKTSGLWRRNGYGRLVEIGAPKWALFK